MAKKYAREVFSFDLGRTIDRTKEVHTIGVFDVDFRKLNAPNPRARQWTYGGSRKTIDAIQKDAQKLRDQLGVDTRIVYAPTGEVLQVSSRKLREVM